MEVNSPLVRPLEIFNPNTWIRGRGVSSLTGMLEAQMLPIHCSMDDFNHQVLSAAIERIQSGDKAALGILYDLYGKVVYSVSLKMLNQTADAEEATQDAFLSLWKHADGLVGKPAKVLPWLLRVVRNRSIDKMRKANRRVPSSQVIETPETTILERDYSETHTALDSLLSTERSDRVKQALKQLPPEQQTVIELAYFKGFSQSEIAQEVGESLGTIKSRARYALTRLRKELEDCHVI